MTGLIEVALKLANADPKKPSRFQLRRAVSTAYYALFEGLCAACADIFIGGKRDRETLGWLRIFRGVDHENARLACRQNELLKTLHPGISIFATQFIVLQDQRYKADYDPTSKYNRAEVLVMISEAKAALKDFEAAPKSDRRQFCAHALCKKRKGV